MTNCPCRSSISGLLPRGERPRPRGAGVPKLIKAKRSSQPWTRSRSRRRKPSSAVGRYARRSGSRCRTRRVSWGLLLRRASKQHLPTQAVTGVTLRAAHDAGFHRDHCLDVARLDVGVVAGEAGRRLERAIGQDGDAVEPLLPMRLDVVVEVLDLSRRLGGSETATLSPASQQRLADAAQLEASEFGR